MRQVEEGYIEIEKSRRDLDDDCQEMFLELVTGFMRGMSNIFVFHFRSPFLFLLPPANNLNAR
jgi:hypothetical protein